jgi:hypothetical protein
MSPACWWKEQPAGRRSPDIITSMNTSIPSPAGPRRSAGRWLAVLGLVTALLGVLGYVLQISVLKLLTVPWYMPIFGMAGAGLLIWSLFYSRSVWRIVGVILFSLLAAGEWYVLLAFSRLPAYTGPVAVGKPFPAFKTVRADGTPFTQKRLQGDKDTVMVFFRGRW